MNSDERAIAIAKAAEDGDLVELSKTINTSPGLYIFDQHVHRERCFAENATALSEASRNGHLDCVRMLLETRAGYSLKTYKLAMINAAIGGHMECFRFLMIARLFKTLFNVQKYTDFIDASTEGKFDRVLQLLDGNKDEDFLCGWKGLCLMNLFIVSGCPSSCLQALIDQGVDVNQLDYNGMSPLMCAVLARNLMIIRFLLSLGVKVNRASVSDECHFLQDGTTVLRRYMSCNKSSQNTTALMYAASCSTDILRELLKFLSEEDVNFVNKMGRSALTYATYYGNEESVSLLIKAGAHVDLVDNSCHWNFSCFSFNILHYAIVARNAHTLELLLQTASIECIEFTTSNVAVCVHDLNCLRVLVNYIISKSNIDNIPYKDECFHKTLLMQAALKGCIESVCLLLEHGADVNLRNCYGETALMFACHDNRVNVLGELIGRGADVTIQNAQGDSAIMYTAINNSVSCLQKLVSHRASVHVRNNMGETPLMLACLYGHDEFVTELINLGADVKAQNENGETACMCAFRHRHEKCVELLLAAVVDLDVVDKDKGLALRFMDEELFYQDIQIYCGNAYACHGSLLNSERDEISIVKKPPGTNLDQLTSTSLAIKLGFFNWDWCLRYENDEVDEIVSSAVFLGICPARMNGKHPNNNIYGSIGDVQLSPLLLAFLQYDSVCLLKFILANRFFFPEEFSVLVSDEPLTEYIWLTEHNSPGRCDILLKLTKEPMSLKTWSFLTVSKAVSLGGPPARRPSRVDKLPIPDSMKRALKFETSISRLSYLHWDSLTIEEVFDSLNFRNEITWRWGPENGYDDDMFDCCDKMLSRLTLPSNYQPDC